MDPQGGYVGYIMNPKSGAGSGKQIARRFRDYLCQAGVEVRTVFTQSLNHARELAAGFASDDGCMLVIAAGGDGTVRQVGRGLEGAQKPMMVIPCGTENLIANEIGYDERLATLIKTFESDNVKSLDLCSANGACFGAIAGIGFDAEVVHRVHRDRLGHINHLDYFWPIWRTFWEHKFPTLDIKVDGEEIFHGQGMAFVGNISRYAVGLQILQHADFSDGLLDVCIYQCHSKPIQIKHSLMTMLKMHADKGGVIYRQGKSVEVSSSDSNVYTQIDGDSGPQLPMKIGIIPQAVKLLVPPNAKPAGIRTRIMRALG
jgi:diacylglycerol kinase (ATP)